MNFLAVFIGGGIGAVLRYLAGLLGGGKLCQATLATFSVNIIACFILGLCFSIFETKLNLSPSVKLALTCGFCGGLSTLSTLALEFLLVQETNTILAVLYVVTTFICAIGAVALGMWAGKLF